MDLIVLKLAEKYTDEQTDQIRNEQVGITQNVNDVDTRVTNIENQLTQNMLKLGNFEIRYNQQLDSLDFVAIES